MLVFYYIAAVLLIIVGVYAAFVALFTGVEAHAGEQELGAAMELWRPDLFLRVAGGTLLIVVAGTAYKVNQLSAGGEAVATMLGGRLVHAGSADADEKKLLNVVEEVAIASGVPVPRLVVLDNEQGINAFAAGLTVNDAVIGVTRGCIARLSRDELQGVIAHEFSHIVNGDMRLNIRLIGVLNGILVLGIVGYFIFRSSLFSSGRVRTRSSSRSGGNRLPLLVFGLLVMAIGYIGVFFGKLIKSAVSRQREYLSDAAAVQFTRNPDGIAGALKKIGGVSTGSRVTAPHAEETSHLFFANGLQTKLSGLMATHPPLEERIRRIDAAFDGELRQPASAAAPGGAAALSGLAGAAEPTMESDPEAVVASVGMPRKSHMEYAARILAEIPEPVMGAVHEPYGARAAVYALLLDPDPEVSRRQKERLASHADAQVYQETMRLASVVGGLKAGHRLPLVEIALGTLKDLSARQYSAFRENVQHLTDANNRVSLFEYALQRMLMRHLDPVFLRQKEPGVRYRHIRPLRAHVETLLSALAHGGSDRAEESAQAFRTAAARLGEDVELALRDREQCGLDAVDAALAGLARLTPTIKKQMVNACMVCVAANGRVTVAEAELLRVVADALGCPVPPLLPGNMEEMGR